MSPTVFHADSHDDKILGNFTLYEVFYGFFSWGSSRIFLPISPPTKSVGGSNSGNRGYF